MEQQQVRVLGIAPYEGMKRAMEHAAEEDPFLQLDVFIGDLEEGVSIAKEHAQEGYDCIISRGGTAELIRHVTDVPVIEIQISVYDVLRAIKLAENYSKLYAIVGFSSITEPAHILCDLLRYNVDILTVHNTDEVRTTLARLQMGGYKMVVSDMVTHTIARQMGMDAFLITSGVESLHEAFEQAQALGASVRRLRQENLFLHSIAQAEDNIIVVLDTQGGVYYSSQPKPDGELLALLRSKMTAIPEKSVLKFYDSQQGFLYYVTGKLQKLGKSKYYLFHCQATQIPLRSNKIGIRFFNKGEAEHLFTNSFYSISGAMGELDNTISSIATTRQAVLIVGENGTGKEQIARAIYLRGTLSNKPFVVVNCSLINDKTWDFLLKNYNSPLSDSGCTVYFQYLEELSPERCGELVALIRETGLARRERLLFSCSCVDNMPLPEAGRLFSTRIDCLTLRLPSLRSRSDEIPSLATLYLGNLNLEIGKQISGFDPHAVEQLQSFDWPNNYTQFQQVLTELATVSDTTYIRSSMVAEVLAKERALNRSAAAALGGMPAGNLTLEQITYHAVQQSLVAHNGNQTAAARQLGISRTTLWRYLSKDTAPEPEPEPET